MDPQENESSDKGKGKKGCNYRHDLEKTARLEEKFKEIDDHLPTDQQRLEIGQELGLQPRQVRNWFQNRRTQKRNQDAKDVNSALRVENEKMLEENIRMKETLKNTLCASCKGPTPKIDEEHYHTLERLKHENALLKEEHEKRTKFLERYRMKQVLEEQLQLTFSKTSSLGDHVNLGVDLSLGIPSASLDENVLPKPTTKMTAIEKTIMLKAVMIAKEELLKLLYNEEPLWVKSQVDRRPILGQHYDKFFPRVNHFNGAKVRVESSKDSRIVRINAAQLVDMLLDSEKWNYIFSTIVTKAQTIEEIERGSSENRSGALLLMYEEMHVLSHLVPSRELYIIRYCEQIEVGIWVILDLSYDYLKDKERYSYTWKYPSGCMIRQISNTSSQVVWVEHIEIEDNIQAHYLYRDIVNSTIAFGAERWLMELQRMCERFSSVALEHIPTYDSGVVTLPEGRRKVSELSHRMVKSFCKVLTMSNMMKYPQFPIEDENCMDRISIQKNIDLFPNDMVIITIVSSFSVPLPSHILFDFFKDPQNRFKWDVLCHGNPWHEVAHISFGTPSNNYISIVQPLEAPPPDGVVIIQESFIDSFGLFVVYSPVNIPELNLAINGQDSPNVSLLPSGIIISEDNKSLSNDQSSSSSRSGKGGSVLTMAIQILMANLEAVNVESLASVKSLMTSTVKSIKDAFLHGSN